MLSPMCWATSRLSARPRLRPSVREIDGCRQQVVDLRHRVDRELDVDDRADDAGDAPDAAGAVGLRVSVSVAVMGFEILGTLLGPAKGAGATDDLADLLGDLGLAGLVGQRV